MSVVLQTGVMYYRENQSDDWHPLILKVDADLSSFIEDYSQRTWELGEYCRYHDVIYRCTTAIETAEAWDSTHWTATDVGEELKALNDDLDETKDTINTVEGTLAIPQNGNIASLSIPVGAYIYLTGNTNGLADGFYRNKSSSAISSGTTFTSSNLEAQSGTSPRGALNSLNAYQLDLSGRIDSLFYTCVLSRTKKYTCSVTTDGAFLLCGKNGELNFFDIVTKNGGTPYIYHLGASNGITVANDANSKLVITMPNYYDGRLFSLSKVALSFTESN